MLNALSEHLADQHGISVIEQAEMTAAREDAHPGTDMRHYCPAIFASANNVFFNELARLAAADPLGPL